MWLVPGYQYLVAELDFTPGLRFMPCTQLSLGRWTASREPARANGTDHWAMSLFNNPRESEVSF